MYIRYNKNPRDNYYAGDCVIRAISIVTGDTWEQIYTALCAEGFYIGDWGRYSREESRDDFMSEIEELMEKAPDEKTRKKFERLMAEM